MIELAYKNFCLHLNKKKFEFNSFYQIIYYCKVITVILSIN